RAGVGRAGRKGHDPLEIGDGPSELDAGGPDNPEVSLLAEGIVRVPEARLLLVVRAPTLHRRVAENRACELGARVDARGHTPKGGRGLADGIVPPTPRGLR